MLTVLLIMIVTILCTKTLIVKLTMIGRSFEKKEKLHAIEVNVWKIRNCLDLSPKTVS